MQIIAVGIFIIIAILDYVKTDKRTVKFKKFRRLLFILIFVSLIPNLFVIIYDELTKQQEVANLNQQINALKQQGDVAKNLLTGGDSFAYIKLHPREDNSVNFLLYHGGNYPLFDVRINVIDEDMLRAFVKLNPNEDKYTLVNKSEIFFKEIGNLSTDGVVPLTNITLPINQDFKDYIVFIQARNGTITENIKFRKVNGIWLSAVRAKNDKTHQQIYEEVSPNFPHDIEGNVN